MVPRITGTVFLIVLAASAVAQQGKTITVKFASEGPQEVWIQQGPTPSEPESKHTVSGKAIQLDVPVEVEGMIVCALDVKSGRVGSAVLSQVAKKGEWTFDPSKSKTVYRVGFLIQHDGKPVASGVVKIKDGNGNRESLMTPTDKGIATFKFVTVGDVDLSVEYKTSGKNASLPSQVFEVTSGEKPILVTIDDPVETVKPESHADALTASTKGQDAPAATPTNPAGTIVNMLVGLLIIGGIGYAIYRYVTQNPDKTAAALGRAGVPIDPSDPNAGQAKQTGPPKQIILDDQSTVSSTDAVGFTGAQFVVRNPRLVKLDGSIHMILEGTCSVGRDAAADLPHPSESSMSRNHASIERQDETIILKDSGSTNGTFVNGRRITDPTPLSPGDTVQFGAVQYRYEE